MEDNDSEKDTNHKEQERTSDQDQEDNSSLLMGGFGSLVWGKKRRRELSIAERVKVIQEKDGNPTASQEQLGRLFDISQAQVSRILKHRDDILHSWKKINNKTASEELGLIKEENCSTSSKQDSDLTEHNMQLRKVNEIDIFEDKLSYWYHKKLQSDLDVHVNNAQIQDKAKSFAKELGIDIDITDYWVIVWKAKTTTKFSMLKEGISKTNNIRTLHRKRRHSDISESENVNINRRSLSPVIGTGGIVFPGQEIIEDQDDNGSEKSSNDHLSSYCNNNLGSQRRYVKKNYQLPSTMYLEQEKLIEEEVQKNMEMIKARLKQSDDWRATDSAIKESIANGIHDRVRQKKKLSNQDSPQTTWYHNKDKSIEVLIKAALDNMDILYREQLIQTVGMCTTRILGLCGYTTSDIFIRIKEEDFMRMEELMQSLLNDMTDQTKDWLVGDKPLLKLLILRGGAKNFRFLPADVSKMRALAQIFQQKISPTFILGLQTLSNHLVSPTTSGIQVTSDNNSSKASTT